MVARHIVVRWFAIVASAALLGSFVAVSGALSASAAGEGTILSLVNSARSANGLGPLALNVSMSAVSEAWANQMAANGAMTHNPSFSSQIPGGWSRAGENVAQGYGSPSAVHDGWMNSPGHRANILGDYTDIGIAFVTAGGTTWAVENFAKYGASVPAPAPPAPPPAPAPPAPAPPAPPAPAPPAPPPASAAPPSAAHAPTAATVPSNVSSTVPSAVPSAVSSIAPSSEPFTRRSTAPTPAVSESPTAGSYSSPSDHGGTGSGLAAMFATLGGILALLVAGGSAWTGVLLRRRWLK